MPLYCGNNKSLLLFDDGFGLILIEPFKRNLSIAQNEMVEVCQKGWEGETWTGKAKKDELHG